MTDKYSGKESDSEEETTAKSKCSNREALAGMYVAAVSRQPMDLYRLEDLVGAVAVAVLPVEGHGRLAGGTAVHPLTGLAIPVVASTTVTGLVNPALGTCVRSVMSKNFTKLTSTLVILDHFGQQRAKVTILMVH